MTCCQQIRDVRTVAWALSFCLDCCAGDPIEVGAATSVLKGGASGLHMTAAKSRMGHAEPAAGAIGILHVRLRVTRRRPVGSCTLAWPLLSLTVTLLWQHAACKSQAHADAP